MLRLNLQLSAADVNSNEIKMLAAVNGIKNNCSKKGIIEKTAIPSKMASGRKRPGFNLIPHKDNTPEPVKNCRKVKIKMVKMELIN
jgi:hypothetical protein